MNCPKCKSTNTEPIIAIAKELKELWARTLNKPFECKDCKHIFNGHPDILWQKPLTDKEQ